MPCRGAEQIGHRQCRRHPRWCLNPSCSAMKAIYVRSARQGRFELSNGALFLDEIGDVCRPGAAIKITAGAGKPENPCRRGATRILRLISVWFAPPIKNIEGFVDKVTPLFYRINVFHSCCQPGRARRGYSHSGGAFAGAQTANGGSAAAI